MYESIEPASFAACSRSLSVVQENLLADLVYPTEIVGKRTRVQKDGSKILKIHLQDKFNADKACHVRDALVVAAHHSCRLTR